MTEINERRGTIGAPVPRYEARAKVTGTATFGSDTPIAGLVHACFITSRIARGRIRAFDLAAAKALPQVVDILTHKDIGDSVHPLKHVLLGGGASNTVRPMSTDQISYAGQIVAVALAETFEAASDAAFRVIVDYEEAPSTATFDCDGAVEQPLQSERQGFESPSVGDFTTAFANSQVRIDARYSTPTQHHNPIELFTVTCVWNGDELTVYEPSQSNAGKKFALAAQLGIDPEKVRVVSPFVGGGFGSKGVLTQRTAIIALAARKLGRPVKSVPSREQGFTLVTYRAETRHRIRLGASRDGRLLALSHDGIELTSRADPYAVAGTDASTRLYHCPNIASSVHIVRADRSTPGFMRAPPEMPYLFALESAMDELAAALDMDPIELRRINDTQTEPIKGLPYTSRALMECYDKAAAAFGWHRRNPKPGSMRNGDWRVGLGCASSAYPALAAPSAARIRVFAEGRVQVEAAGHELGQGQYTVAAQFAAERLVVPLESVSVRLGDTNLPPVPPAAGSVGTVSLCSAIAKACEGLRARLGPSAKPDEDLFATLRRQGIAAMEQLAEWAPPGAQPGATQALYRGHAWPIGSSDRIQASFGAQFVEVHVHVRTGEIRVPRLVGAFAAGRIINARTARSQYMGGMIWGLSSALHEETLIDRSSARYVNANLADYLLPVNADIGDVEVIMVPEEDKVIPLGVKGIGEIGTVGTAAAVANAVFHATGLRLRDLPLRLEYLLT